jgi:hypothetical protein
MKALDKNYLSLQFRNKIHSKNGTEFQSFFENIMEKAFPNFKKVPSASGDGGNDGWIKELGRYYQVYAPNTPATKDSFAASKLKKDFQKLKENWNNITEIREYYFVFNDKYLGSQKPESEIVELEINNPHIVFKVFLAKDLEKLFFELSESDILSLGFDIDHRQAISIAYTYLEGVRTELDRGISKSAQIILGKSKDIILALNDEKLSLEYEILECLCLQRLEKINEAKGIYKSISKRFPKDPRSFLYLAEIYLKDRNFSKNKELLEKAESIDNNFWLLKWAKLLRELHLGEKIDPKNIDEKEFLNDSKVKSIFYCLFAVIYKSLGDQANADSFIEKAIHLNPDSLRNHMVKLSLIETRLFSSQHNSEIIEKSQELLKEIEKVEIKFLEYGDIGVRNKAILNDKKLNAFRAQENFLMFEKVAQENFKLSISCYLDNQIQQILTSLLKFVSLPDHDFNQLLEYIKISKALISDEFSKVIIFKFIKRDILFTDGKKFFKEINNENFCNFISDVEKHNDHKVLEFLKSDPEFAVTIANTLKKQPILRRKIIDDLPDKTNIQKQKLLLLLYFEEKNFDEVLKILKQLDLSNLNHLECMSILQIIHDIEAWDFEIIVLQKLLEKEKRKQEAINLKLELFNAYLNLKKHRQVMELGELLLQEDPDGNTIDSQNKEVLLSSTINACFERGKFNKKSFTKSKEILEKYPLKQPSFEFKVGIEAEVYLKNNEAEKALKSAIEGIKIKKVLSSNEYAKLHFLLVIRIAEQTGLNLDSLDKVKENTFVKLINKDQWYFIGDDNELDTIKVSKTSNRYQLFIDKMIGEKIVFENNYATEERKEAIDAIFTIEKYVLWQSIENFQKLSKDGDLEGVQIIEISQKEETIDHKNLLKFLEDLNKKTEPFFELYCKNDIPLSMLAKSEGGLTDAIARIQQENKGFINFCIGTIEEFDKQKEIAKKVIAGELPFYIDGTSALFLSAIGLFPKIYSYLPNFKVPQSVINLLADTTNKWEYGAEQAGHMGYVQGKIRFLSVEKDKRDLIQSNFIKSIEKFELNPENISIISSANKVDCFSEKEIPGELCDACILAQKDDLPILTEDYLYLMMNQLETKKKVPEYFSSLALLRVLYEDKRLSFNDYLEYFGYLSTYRFRFLFLNLDDIEKAVFGDEKIKTISPENIRKFNFPLTLSEEYGVQVQTVFALLGGFLLRALMDNTVTVNIVEKIFIEILESLPMKMNKKDFGQWMLGFCFRAIEDSKSKLIIVTDNHLVHEKLNKLQQATEIYGASKLWVPN